MSHNSKNLSYETKEPPFLQRLKSQYGNTSGRLERPIARPRKPKDHDDDDEPTYVDEESNEVISKEEYKALVRESDQQKDAQASQGPEGQDKPGSKAEPGEEIISKEPLSSKLNLTEIGGPKKRKQAKIVGDDSVPEGKEKEEKLDGLSQKPKQKKKKKIKLSFDEE